MIAVGLMHRGVRCSFARTKVSVLVPGVELVVGDNYIVHLETTVRDVG